MAQTVAVVRATLSATSGGTTDFTSSGFGTPTAAIVIMCRSNTTNPTQDSATLSVGFWDGTNQRVNSITYSDNLGTTATYRLSRTDGIAGETGSGASATLIGNLYSCSAVTDGIRLTLDVDNTSTERYATVILLAGVSAKVVTHTPGTTDTSTGTTTGLGFAPKLLIGATIGHTARTPNSGSAQTTSGRLSFGVTRQSDSAERMLTTFSSNAAADAALGQLFSEAKFVGDVTTSESWSVVVSSWDSDGFVTTTSGTTSSDIMDVLALGGDVSFDFGTITTRTTTGTTDVTSTVTPDALLAVLGTTDNAGTIVTDSKANGWSVGLANSSAEYSHNFYEEDAAATTNSGSVASATQIINLDSSSAGSRTDLVDATVTFSSGKFTLDYPATPDSTARKGWWLAFGAAAGGGVTVTPGVGALTITGYAPVANLTQSVAPDVGALTITGYAPTANLTQSVAPDVGALTITGYAPVANLTQSVAPDVGALTITGYAPVANLTQSVAPDVGALTITGYAPTINTTSGQALYPDVGALILTGYAPTANLTHSASPDVGALTLTGYAPVANLTHSASPNVGALTITGYAPTVALTQGISVGVAQLLLTGYAPTANVTHSTIPGLGQLSIVGYAPTADVSGPRVCAPEVGAFVITCYAPTVALADTGFWRRIDNTHSASWTEVNDAQTASWTEVNDTQSAGWTQINNGV